MNQKVFLNRIKQTVLAEEPMAQVILYGSRARGDARAESDWDVLVITTQNSRVKEKEIRKALFTVQLDTLQPVSTIIVDKQKWQDISNIPFFKNVNLKGKWL